MLVVVSRCVRSSHEDVCKGCDDDDGEWRADDSDGGGGGGRRVKGEHHDCLHSAK